MDNPELIERVTINFPKALNLGIAWEALREVIEYPDVRCRIFVDPPNGGTLFRRKDNIQTTFQFLREENDFGATILGLIFDTPSADYLEEISQAKIEIYDSVRKGLKDYFESH